MKSADRERLESALYGGTVESRLAALRELCSGVAKRTRVGTNTHIHTNESFSVFRSPTEAVWQAVREGLAVFGINDHYTVAGHEEFGRACDVARIPAAFSLEAVAMDRVAEAGGALMNDPDNPGRVYLCGKGVTRIPSGSSDAMKQLSKLRVALARRNQRMTDKVGELFQARLGTRGPGWQDVVRLTPRGNVTERHVAQAMLVRLRGWATSHDIPLPEAVARCCQDTPPVTDDVSLQGFIRAKLLKAGGVCYVAESARAFISVEEMRDMFLAFGAIPTYPVLGNPVTDNEKDIDDLLGRLESLGIFAIEVIPHRNTRERLAEIVEAAKRRYWPVFNGTEHNTPERMSLLAELSLDADFAPWFEASSAALLGHQWSVKQGHRGFLNEDGAPSIKNPRNRFEHFQRLGRRVMTAMLC